MQVCFVMNEVPSPNPFYMYRTKRRVESFRSVRVVASVPPHRHILLLCSSKRFGICALSFERLERCVHTLEVPSWIVRKNARLMGMRCFH